MCVCASDNIMQTAKLNPSPNQQQPPWHVYYSYYLLLVTPYIIHIPLIANAKSGASNKKKEKRKKKG
ncbi:hypothetical protein BDV26DRAFT_274885 [Aspergillus bertholletiae]|uniref:Uncharacterized protein n=1 Tax=Aspergillus bertholletiae TaxID=1226010 RepID=A0A5N7AQA8_9EURO|nr:hypothetical protein BDV26DRAFT_274885 [Aspergillus bertholletiae]